MVVIRIGDACIWHVQAKILNHYQRALVQRLEMPIDRVCSFLHLFFNLGESRRESNDQMWLSFDFRAHFLIGTHGTMGMNDACVDFKYWSLHKLADGLV